MKLTNQTQILLDFEPSIIKVRTAARKMHSKHYGIIVATLKINKEGILKPMENLHMKNYLLMKIFHYEINAKDTQTQN